MLQASLCKIHAHKAQNQRMDAIAMMRLLGIFIARLWESGGALACLLSAVAVACLAYGVMRGCCWRVGETSTFRDSPAEEIFLQDEVELADWRHERACTRRARAEALFEE